MKSENIIKKLQEAGFEVDFSKFAYWQRVPFVKLENGQRFFLAEVGAVGNSQFLKCDFVFSEVLENIEKTKELLKKIPVQDQENFQILNMGTVDEIKKIYNL